MFISFCLHGLNSIPLNKKKYIYSSSYRVLYKFAYTFTFWQHYYTAFYMAPTIYKCPDLLNLYQIYTDFLFAGPSRTWFTAFLVSAMKPAPIQLCCHEFVVQRVQHYMYFVWKDCWLCKHIYVIYTYIFTLLVLPELSVFMAPYP